MRARPCESGKALPGAAGKAVTEAIVDLPLDAIREGPRVRKALGDIETRSGAAACPWRYLVPLPPSAMSPAWGSALHRNCKPASVYYARMSLKHYHLKSSLLALLDERWAGFCPLCEMAKMLNDPKTPPKLKGRLRKDLDAYTVPQLKPSRAGETMGAEHIEP